jgi:hypothetical protein
MCSTPPYWRFLAHPEIWFVRLWPFPTWNETTQSGLHAYFMSKTWLSHTLDLQTYPTTKAVFLVQYSFLGLCTRFAGYCSIWTLPCFADQCLVFWGGGFLSASRGIDSPHPEATATRQWDVSSNEGVSMTLPGDNTSPQTGHQELLEIVSNNQTHT